MNVLRTSARVLLLIAIPLVALWTILDDSMPIWMRLLGMVAVGSACNSLGTMRRNDGAHRELDDREQNLAARDQVLELREARLEPVRDLVGTWPQPESPRAHERPNVDLKPGVQVTSWSANLWAQTTADCGQTEAADAETLARPAQTGRYRGVHAAQRDGGRWLAPLVDFLRSFRSDDESEEPPAEATPPTALTMPTTEIDTRFLAIVQNETTPRVAQAESHHRHEHAVARVIGATGHFAVGMRGLR